MQQLREALMFQNSTTLPRSSSQSLKIATHEVFLLKVYINKKSTYRKRDRSNH